MRNVVQRIAETRSSRSWGCERVLTTQRERGLIIPELVIELADKLFSAIAGGSAHPFLQAVEWLIIVG
jgi:hypothetical protein